MMRNSLQRRFFLAAAFVFFFGVAFESRAATPISNAACGAVTSPFGPRVAPKKGASSNHPGVDYKCDGSPLYANMEGSLFCKPKSDGNGAGNRCHLQKSCLKFSYFHMKDSSFIPGNRSATFNQPIGLSGDTGNVTGPHLHFEYRVSGAPVDPVYMFGTYKTVEEVCNPDAVKDALDNRNKTLSQPVNEDDAPNPNHGEEVDECQGASPPP